MNTTRIVIVARDPLARTGLAALLADHVSERADCMIAGQLAAPDGEAGDFARDLGVYRPDALLWDLGWDADPDALPDFRDLDQPVIALAVDDSLVTKIQAAGARGILRRDASPGQLIAAVAAVMAGLIVLDPAFVEPRQPVFAADLPETVDLTPRELDVLRLLAEGLANRAIAQQLAISEHTVKFHLNAILGKLAAQSRTEAVVNAIRLGVIVV
jgi:two-component system nitrate/nitrite response regulator NarL